MGKTLGRPILRNIGRPSHHAQRVIPPASGLPEDSLQIPSPSFALVVSHCPWRPDRAEIMRNVRPILNRHGVPYCEITERAPNHVWSRKMWGWGAAQSTTHTVYLQDDLQVHEAFWDVVHAMVKAVPNRIISLISNHPLSHRALDEGHAWFRMSETLGSGYIVPTALMRIFLDHRLHIPERLAASLCEDFILSRWQYETGRRSWCPIPTVIQTIESVPSTNPAIYYPYRRSYIPWTDPRVSGRPITDIGYWTPQRPPPDFGATVSNDSRMPRGPFADHEIIGAHQAAVRR